jgi:5-formyltetrahydrofolate cyclo-ligase
MPNNKTKAELRSAAKSVRKLLKPEERKSASQTICAIAAGTKLFKHAELVACYLASNSEVNCEELLKCAWIMKKRVFVPTIQKNSRLEFVELHSDSKTRPNKFGIHEPVEGVKIDPRELDLVFAPLVAFDSEKNRIGMGGGYYDRAFSFLLNEQRPLKPQLIGLAFDCQCVEVFDASPLDITLFQLISESRIIS